MKRNGLTSIVFSETPPNTNYTAGRWSWVSDNTAQEYIEDGYGKEWKPDEPVEPEVETISPDEGKYYKPTDDDTVEYIKNYLKQEGIEFSSSLKKQQLLDLIDGE